MTTTTIRWTQTNAENPDYWLADKGGFWITSRMYHSLHLGGSSRKRWVLFGGPDGEHELGVYDTIDEAKEGAEPHVQ